MLNIIQWNIHGYNNNYNNLLTLIKHYNPKIISLQETYIHNVNNIPIPINFSLYNVNTSTTRYGGVALLIHNSIQHKLIDLNKDFDSIGLEIASRLKFRIIACYIPPKQSFTYNNLDNMFRITIPPS